MKLRTTHNSIRIRIRKSEMTTLGKAHYIEESIGFPNEIVFKFALSIDQNASQVGALLENNSLVLTIPQTIANNWINTNQVSIEHHTKLSNDEQLHLLIEKDFPCLDRENEDKSDTFFELAPKTTPEVC